MQDRARQGTFMRDTAGSERGAALVTVLLVMVVMLILVTTMLARTSSELVIAGRHRDSTRAFEHAQAGLEEAVPRIREAHLFEQFEGSTPNSNVSVRVLRHVIGAGGSVMEIQSDATVGLARRRLSLLILQIVEEMIPDIMYGKQVTTGGNVTVEEGDVYSRLFVRYKRLPLSAETKTFAAWRISKDSPGPIPFCYTPADCPPAQQGKWFPGHRRAEYDEVLSANPNTDLDFSCDLVGTTYASNPLQTTPIYSAVGWVSGDRRHDRAPTFPGTGNNMVENSELLKGCTDDGLPYVWVRETFQAADATPVQTLNMWFRTISFAQWFDKYWQFNEDTLDWEPTNPLVADPTLGAVPPPPPFERLASNFDRKDSDGNVGQQDDIGTCVNPVAGVCGTGSTPKIVLMDPCPGPGNECSYQGGNIGHGTLLVNGDMRVTGTVIYYGTIIVKGKLVGSGNVTLYGGLVGEVALDTNGDLEIHAGTMSNTIPVGRATVERRAWFER